MNDTNISDVFILEGDMRIPSVLEAIMYIMYITVSVAAIGGNGMICYIVLAYQRMRTVTNFFILNLAVGDIMMACLCIPFGFVSNLLLQYWPFGAVMCVLVSYAQVVSVFISAYTMIAISIDRYIAILYPLRPRLTKLQAKVIIVIVWLVALLTPLPTAVLSRLEVHPAWSGEENGTIRYVCMESWKSKEQRYYYSMTLMVLQYFFPLSVLLYTYTRIAIVVWGNKPPGEAEDMRDQRLAASKRKMVKMMITVVTVFTLCWLPLNMLIVVGDQDERIWQYKNIVYVWFVCHWLAMSHASYNPIIYCWMNSKFREGFLQIIRYFACKRLRNRCCEERNLHRCNTYSTYTSVRNLSVRGTSPKLHHENGHGNGKCKFDRSPTPSTRLMVQHVCRYDTCVSEEEIFKDTEV
ncbi:RYamide receptor-like [Parasteatoda tepidariorum]|uniref:RYamide receptor-like n=1 Tax=Parasteatoda tepidariorum TaxID=114398 RepID=UPI00077FBE0D|nr:RYamide receptor-like [Parasteatoda tepidariorum]